MHNCWTIGAYLEFLIFRRGELFFCSDFSSLMFLFLFDALLVVALLPPLRRKNSGIQRGSLLVCSLNWEVKNAALRPNVFRLLEILISEDFDCSGFRLHYRAPCSQSCETQTIRQSSGCHPVHRMLVGHRSVCFLDPLCTVNFILLLYGFCMHSKFDCILRNALRLLLIF